MDFAALLREEIEAKKREAKRFKPEPARNENETKKDGEDKPKEISAVNPKEEMPTKDVPQVKEGKKLKEKKTFVFEEGDPMAVQPITRDLFEEDPSLAMQLVASFFSRLLHHWSLHPGEAEPEQQQAYELARLHLPILLRLIQKGQLAANVQGHLVSIAAWLQQREYIRAADAYLRLAIGNAPWPIGVTSVTIHERSALSRIKQSEVAHVLNDEQSRKWIQSIKRIMSACQRLYPPSDPSKLMG